MNYVGSFKSDPEKAFGIGESVFSDWTFQSVVAIVFCFVFVFIFVKKDERKAMMGRIKSLGGIFLFSIYLILSAILFPSEAGLLKVQSFICFNFFACLLFVGLVQKPRDLVIFLGFVVLFGLFMSTISFLFEARHPFHFLATGDNFSRSWTYIQYGALATSAGLILLIWSIEAFSNVILRVVAISGALLCFFGVIYSGERGSILFVPLILLFYLFSSRRIFYFMSWKFFWMGLILIATVVGTARFLQTEMGQVFLSRIDKLGVFDKQNAEEVDSRLDAEGEFFRPFLENLGENPLLGAGPGNYFGIDEKGYPHNIFLEIGGELGAAGLVFYFAFIFMAFRGYKIMKKNWPPFVSYAYLVVFLLFFFRTFKTGDIVGNRYFWLLLSLYVSCPAIFSFRSLRTKANESKLRVLPPDMN